MCLRSALRPTPPHLPTFSPVQLSPRRKLVFNTPAFLTYFHTATPQGELGKLNIGSRPARRKAADAGVGSLRAIPWIFAWTQTRHVLPSWLGVGEALEALSKEEGQALREMAVEWPFFRSTISLIEMTLAKANMFIAATYDKVRTLLRHFCPAVRGWLAYRLASRMALVISACTHTSPDCGSRAYLRVRL
jgi:phosphoenolpyruvate carboxylase